MSLFLSQSVLRPRSPLLTDPSHRFVNEISEKSKFLQGDDKNRKNSPFSGRKRFLHISLLISYPIPKAPTLRE